MNGELRVVDDVPDAFAAVVAESFDRRGGETFAVALSGGGTARRCYLRLADHTAIAWPSVRVYWGDERCVPCGSPASNWRLAQEALLSRVQPRAVHPMRCEDGPAAYEALLREAPTLDLAHLGLGADGHTASLFSGSAALTAPAERLVAESEDPTGQNPFRRLTLTLGGIARFAVAVVTVEGATKRQALDRVRSGDPSAPASRLWAPTLVWLADAAASGAAEGTRP